MKNIIILGTLLILVSCTNKKGYWYKKDSSQDEYAKINYLCLQESQQHSSRSSLSYNYQESKAEMVTNNALFNACMNAKGFYWKELTN